MKIWGAEKGSTAEFMLIWWLIAFAFFIQIALLICIYRKKQSMPFLKYKNQNQVSSKIPEWWNELPNEITEWALLHSINIHSLAATRLEILKHVTTFWNEPYKLKGLVSKLKAQFCWMSFSNYYIRKVSRFRILEKRWQKFHHTKELPRAKRSEKPRFVWLDSQYLITFILNSI